MLLLTTSSPEGSPLVPSRRHQDPLSAPRRGFPALTQWRRNRRAAAENAATPVAAVPDQWDAAGGEPISGASDASAWEAALARAAADPRAKPLSAVRLAVDAPGLSGPDLDAELARLQAIATVRWREILRPADTLAQVGPSEFAVLLPRCDAQAAETIAGRLQLAVPEAARSRAGVATSARADASRLAAEAARALVAAETRRDPLTDPARLELVDDLRSALGSDDFGVRDAELDELASGTATLLGAPTVVVTLVEDRLLHLAGAHGLDALDGHQDGVPLDLTLCQHAVAGGRPVLVSDTARHGIAGAAGAELRLGIAACASVPVMVSGVIAGTVCALRRERYEWTDDDTAVLRVAAERAERRLHAALAASGHKVSVL